jgi:hypothetical protein
MIVFCPRCGARIHEKFLGEVPDTMRRCDDCALIVTDEPLMLVRGNEEDEVQYDLAEWQVGERAAATSALLDVDIPYRWEESLVLTVPAVAEDEVDRLLDELEEVEELEAAEDEADEGDELGGDIEAHTAMGDLFVAADRLQHDPTDVRMVADALEAELIVADAGPPYGVEKPVWRQIQALAATLSEDLQESADEETVAASARALREYLRDLV